LGKHLNKIINKIAKRPEKKEPTFGEELTHTAKELIMGPEKEGEGEKAKYSWAYEEDEETGERQISLTPGEREIITEVENKLKKPAFRTAFCSILLLNRKMKPVRLNGRKYLLALATAAGSLNLTVFSTNRMQLLILKPKSIHRKNNKPVFLPDLMTVLKFG
jgi:hypothetical protein